MEYKTSKEGKFDSIYLAYKDDVYRISYKYTKNEDLAHEITQKAFFQFYTHMDKANIKSARGYLMRTARNLAFNLTRDTKYEQIEAEMCALEEDSASTISVEDAYIMDEQRKRQDELKKSILERLREENELWYEAINLVCCLEKPQELVAEELGVSKDVLYSRLYRARKWIHKNFGEEFDELVRRS
ncbi:MAG: sigma-70 family RNA polymerase sigma factor [Tyzzerella sp.]|nr:sigma-70 family RNA polymerase sigma factor [Tyzzerella sp.]